MGRGALRRPALGAGACGRGPGRDVWAEPRRYENTLGLKPFGKTVSKGEVGGRPDHASLETGHPLEGTREPSGDLGRRVVPTH